MFESFFGAKKLNRDWKAPEARPTEKLPTDESTLQYPPGDIRNKMVSTVTTSDKYRPGWDAKRDEEKAVTEDWDKRIRTGGPSDNTQSGTREAFANLKHQVDMEGAIDISDISFDEDNENNEIEQNIDREKAA